MRSAVWMMRALVASNVLSSRGTVLFVPVNTAVDSDGTRITDAVVRVYGYACARGVVPAAQAFDRLRVQ